MRGSYVPTASAVVPPPPKASAVVPTPISNCKQLTLMAYKIYKYVDLSEVRTIAIFGLRPVYPVVYTEDRVEMGYNSIKNYNVSGFIHYGDGYLVVQCVPKEHQAVTTIAKYWRRHRLRSAFRRNEVALKCVAEYFGHPRFQDFSVGEE